MNKQLSKVLSMPQSSAAKRVLTLGVSAVLAISVTACGDDGGTDDNVIDLPDTGAEPSATTQQDGAAPSATTTSDTDGGTVPGDGGSDADPGSPPDGGDDDGSVPTSDGGSLDGGSSDASGPDTGVVPPLEDCLEANEEGCFESCAPVEQEHFLNKCTDGCFAFDNAERLPLYVNGQLPDLTQ